MKTILTKAVLAVVIIGIGVAHSAHVKAITRPKISIEQLAERFRTFNNSGIGRVATVTDSRASKGYRYLIRVLRRQSGTATDIIVCTYQKLYAGQVVVFSVAGPVSNHECSGGYLLADDDPLKGYLLKVLSPPVSQEDLLQLPGRIDESSVCVGEDLIFVRSSLFTKRKRKDMSIALNEDGIYVPLRDFLGCVNRPSAAAKGAE